MSLIRGELNDAALGYQEIVHIRVTMEALLGSPVSVPVTPERARTLAQLRLLPNGAVVADPVSYERLLELLIHPADWVEVLKEAGAAGAAVGAVALGEPQAPTRVYGVAVTHG